MKKVQTSDPRTHYVEMDALRGLAILSVVAIHIALQWKYTWTASGQPPSQLPLTIPLLGMDVADLFFLEGVLAFYLFFLLSGYLLTWSEDERMRRGTYSVRSYALRRALRILPAYYVAIPIVATVWPTEPSVKDVLLNLSFLWVILHPFQVNTLDATFWSLTSEVIFYFLLLPFVVAKLPRLRQRLVVLGLLFALSLGVRIYIAQSGLSAGALQSGTLNLAYLTQLPAHLSFFMAGVLLRTIVERLGDLAKWRWRPLVSSALLLVSVSFFVTYPYLIGAPSHPATGPFGSLQAVMLEMIMTLVVIISFFASAVLGAPFLRGVLRWKPLVFVGVISYSMYLLNETVQVIEWNIMQRIRNWAVSEGTSLAVWAGFSAYALGVLVVSLIIAYLGYRYVESPFLRRKPT